jgi:hypothetical protein
MMEDYKTKDMAEPKDDVTFKAVSSVTYEFFFPGSGKWQAMSVRAQSREEAQQYWEANRKPVNPGAAEPVEETRTNET